MALQIRTAHSIRPAPPQCLMAVRSATVEHHRCIHSTACRVDVSTASLTFAPVFPAGVCVRSQYGFIQVSPNGAGLSTAVMYAVLSGLSTSTSYYVSFYWGVRVGGDNNEPSPNATMSTLTLTYGSQTVWASPSNIADSNGYAFVQTAAFTPTAAQATFAFTVNSADMLDQSILVDAVMIMPTNVDANGTVAVNSVTDFDSPVIEGDFDYNTPVTPYQPWSWTPGQGGRAKLGGPFDPPAPSAPPSGNQVSQPPLTPTVTLLSRVARHCC